MPTLTSRVQRSLSPLCTEIDGEIVMMDVDSGSYFNLDAIGSDIWRRLEQPVTVADLCDGLAADYAADLETIRRDVLALLGQMTEKGLVTVEG